MKKIAGSVLTLAAVMSLTAVGCSNKKGGSANTGSSRGSGAYAEVKTEVDPATKKLYDFKGMSVIIGDWWSNPDAVPGSKQEEDTKAFRDWLGQTYNFKAVQSDCAGWAEHPKFVSNFCVTGGDENYVFIIDGRSANSGVKANLFYDLSKIPNIDWSKAKWDQGVIGKLKRGNSFYAFSYGKPEPKNGMFFNKRILQENGYDPDYPYDLQAQGKWTWETFEEMCKKLTRDTDNDGVIDQYAMSSFNTEFAYAALDSNGASIIGRNADGTYFNNAGSEKSMEAWNWIARMFAQYQLPQAEGASWDYFYTAFINGETAFLADQEYNAQPNGRFSSMKDDWGFVCFPLGPSGDGKYHTIHDSNMWVIPSVYDDARAAKIMKIVDFYTDDVPGYDDPDSWKDAYYAGFRDTRAVDETLQLMMDTPNPRFDTLISGLNQGDIIWGVTGGSQTPQEAYEACKNSWQSLIDDANN